MKTRNIVTVTTGAILIMFAGCMTPAPKEVKRIPFPDSEYASLPKAGTATIRGQAFLKTRGGDVKTAAGNEVFLNPVTSYSLEWFNKSRQGMRLEQYDPKLTQYWKTKIADGDGRFVFKNVPPGEYFLTTDVTWEVPHGRVMSTQGGLVTKYFKVSEGEEIDIVINELVLGQDTLKR